MNKTVRKMATIIQDKTSVNPKHEIRNSKQSQMTKFQMFQTREFRNFEFRIFKLQPLFGFGYAGLVNISLKIEARSDQHWNRAPRKPILVS